MIPIDERKFPSKFDILVQCCKDESVRFVRYTNPEKPTDYVTIQKCPNYYGKSTEYSLSVHLPKVRYLSTLVIVQHTSVNCWKVIVSTAEFSEVYTVKTLNEVLDIYKRAFADNA